MLHSIGREHPRRSRSRAVRLGGRAAAVGSLCSPPCRTALWMYIAGVSAGHGGVGARLPPQVGAFVCPCSILYFHSHSHSHERTHAGDCSSPPCDEKWIPRAIRANPSDCGPSAGYLKHSDAGAYFSHTTTSEDSLGTLVLVSSGCRSLDLATRGVDRCIAGGRLSTT